MMNQEDLFRKLGAILNELNDQYEYLAQNPQKFNELELELFLANANFLAEHVQIIRKINSTRSLKELPEHTEPKEELPVPASIKEEATIDEISEKEWPVLQEPQPTIFKIEEEAPSFEFVLHEKPSVELAELPFVEPVSHTTPEVVPYQQEEKALEPVYVPAPEPTVPAANVAEELPEIESTPAEESGPEPFLVRNEEVTVAKAAHTLVEEQVETKLVKPTLNELLAGSLKKGTSTTAPSPGPAVRDLKQAINLNDKLLYIKDLFNGYNLAYSEAIELINKMPDFNTADTFLKNNYAVKNNWATKQATVDKFYDLLRRRF